MPSFSDASKENLSQCDTKLQLLFNTVIKYRDCTIIDGHRTKQEQNDAYNAGNSKVRWPGSKHNKLPSKAVDVMPYPIDWNDMDRLYAFANFVEGVAVGLDIKVEWGGRWYSFFDGPHWQIN